jgi:hypothetical protein
MENLELLGDEDFGLLCTPSVTSAHSRKKRKYGLNECYQRQAIFRRNLGNTVLL